VVNEYKPYGYNYNTVNFPHIRLAYNSEDKLLIGFGFDAKTFGFRKDPYETYHNFSTLYAPASGAFHLKYQGIFNQVLLKKDVVVNMDMVSPTLNNFFGLGNQTMIDPSKPIEFYRVRYKYFKADVLLRKRLTSFLDISLGPTYYHYWIKYGDNRARILGKPSFIGSDSQTVYSNKDYLGVKFKMDINFVNNDLLPSRGITWYNEFSSMAGLNKSSNPITKFTSDMTVYASLNEDRQLVGIFRLGGARIFNDNIEYFQALTLGANNFVRGFRKDRFSGTALLYGSVEARVKFFKSQSYILPGDVGGIGFYDVGRVWLKGESSTKWHQSYGGGFYYSPFNILVVSATVGISGEDKLLNFSLGTKFRLTF
ncbi:MAG: BamA/TamA family outer membrane protein, partial [Ginsengibacter sp.]